MATAVRPHRHRLVSRPRGVRRRPARAPRSPHVAGWALVALLGCSGQDTLALQLVRIAPSADPQCGAPADGRTLVVTGLGDFPAADVTTVSRQIAAGESLTIDSFPLDTRVLRVEVLGDAGAVRAHGKTSPTDLAALASGAHLPVFMRHRTAHAAPARCSTRADGRSWPGSRSNSIPGLTRRPTWRPTWQSIASMASVIGRSQSWSSSPVASGALMDEPRSFPSSSTTPPPGTRSPTRASTTAPASTASSAPRSRHCQHTPITARVIRCRPSSCSPAAACPRFRSSTAPPVPGALRSFYRQDGDTTPLSPSIPGACCSSAVARRSTRTTSASWQPPI